jgi:hypothetical protein
MLNRTEAKLVFHPVKTEMCGHIFRGRQKSEKWLFKRLGQFAEVPALLLMLRGLSCKLKTKPGRSPQFLIKFRPFSPILRCEVNGK